MAEQKGLGGLILLGIIGAAAFLSRTKKSEQAPQSIPKEQAPPIQEPVKTGRPKGVKDTKPRKTFSRFKKGTQEAKDYMRSLQEKRKARKESSIPKKESPAPSLKKESSPTKPTESSPSEGASQEAKPGDTQ